MGYTTREMREYMARRRGGATYKGRAEDADVLVAYAWGEITAGRAAAVLGLDVVELRRRLNEAVARGTAAAGVPCEHDERLDAISVDAGMGP